MSLHGSLKFEGLSCFFSASSEPIKMAVGALLAAADVDAALAACQGKRPSDH